MAALTALRRGLTATLLSGTLLATAAGCTSGGAPSDLNAALRPADGQPATSTTAAPATAPPAGDSAAAAPTTTTQAPAVLPSPSTTAATRRPTPGRATPTSTTATTLPPAFEVPAENLRPSPPPPPPVWTPPSTSPPVVVYPWTVPDGVDQTPPYEAPVVSDATYLGCTRVPDPQVARWTVEVRATVTGGRYWQFPGSAPGNTATFGLNFANIAGQPADPNGFDGWITYVPVRLPSGGTEMPSVWPQVKFHCDAL